MTLKADLLAAVGAVIKAQFNERDGNKVPEPEDLALSNEAVKIEAAVLYADIADSTVLVDKYHNWFAAKVYKSFLLCAARLIRWHGGTITAYDGDRVMGVFKGDGSTDAAVRTALRLRYAVDEVIKPTIQATYPTNTYTLKHVVGIDRSPLYVVREGIRGSNDLVWIGRAANYAAKLAARSERYSTYVTADVFSSMSPGLKTDNAGNNLWFWQDWVEFNGSRLYCSNAHISYD